MNPFISLLTFDNKTVNESNLADMRCKCAGDKCDSKLICYWELAKNWMKCCLDEVEIWLRFSWGTGYKLADMSMKAEMRMAAGNCSAWGWE